VWESGFDVVWIGGLLRSLGHGLGGLGAQMDMFDQMPNLHALTWLIHQLETYFSLLHLAKRVPAVDGILLEQDKKPLGTATTRTLRSDRVNTSVTLLHLRRF
jgi:hypothetical protein